MKRLRHGVGLQVQHDQTINNLLEGAEALLCLTAGTSWPMQYGQDATYEEEWLQPAGLPVSSREASAAKGARHVAKAAKAARASYSTRSYVWRGPHRGALKKKQKQQAAGDFLSQEQQQLTSSAGCDTQQHQYPAASDANSSRRGSSSGAAHSDDDEVAQQQQQQQQHYLGDGALVPARQRDKEWAALTTWLRMNLHHPRTAKKLVLFVGQQDQDTGCWTFGLNPGLTWDDVSMETKLRLKTLPLEAEQAFLHKYPDRPRHEWGSKVQKYRPPGDSTTVNVCLTDMVQSLSSIFYQHEPCESAALGGSSSNLHMEQQQQEMVQQQQEVVQQQEQQFNLPELQSVMPSAVVGGAPMPDVVATAMVAATDGNAHVWGQCSSGHQHHVQQQEHQMQNALETAAALHAPASSMQAAAALPPAAAAAVSTAAAAAAAASGSGASQPVLSCRQTMLAMAVEGILAHHPPLGVGKLQLLSVGDGTDSCTESATPIAARPGFGAC